MAYIESTVIHAWSTSISTIGLRSTHHRRWSSPHKLWINRTLHVSRHHGRPSEIRWRHIRRSGILRIRLSRIGWSIITFCFFSGVAICILIRLWLFWSVYSLIYTWLIFLFLLGILFRLFFSIWIFWRRPKHGQIATALGSRWAHTRDTLRASWLVCCICRLTRLTHLSLATSVTLRHPLSLQILISLFHLNVF